MAGEFPHAVKVTSMDDFFFFLTIVLFSKTVNPHIQCLPPSHVQKTAACFGLV